jgi:hypothetical protein
MADLDAATQGWVFGLDNVSLGMFAEEVMSLLGDYNGNGTVEQGDLDLVLLNWGDDLANPVAAGWTNGAPDGAVDQGELDAVLLNWGSAASTVGAAGVPEPSTLILLAIGLGLMAACRLRKRH